MTREEKKKLIESLAVQLQNYAHFYVTDTSGLNASATADLRRKCFDSGVELVVVKNTLFKKALEKVEYTGVEDLLSTLKGETSIMFTSVGNAPARLIKEFRKSNAKPILKSAYIEESVYVGDENVEVLSTLKSKDELIADVVALLQSPVKNVVSALQSAPQTVAGLVKTLSEREG